MHRHMIRIIKNLRDSKGRRIGFWEDTEDDFLTGVQFKFRAYFVKGDVIGAWKSWTMEGKMICEVFYIGKSEMEGEGIDYGN